jgi:type IV secretory pathway ATPase VirB11/archaellum biosynthesis ATPase
MNSNQNTDDVAKIENIKKEEENKRTKENNDNENDIIISGETLSKSRINITFSDMNESNASNATFKTYKSIPFQYDNLDLDIPNFSPTRYKKTNWK